jgi:hypothetical protein
MVARSEVVESAKQGAFEGLSKAIVSEDATAIEEAEG